MVNKRLTSFICWYLLICCVLALLLCMVGVDSISDKTTPLFSFIHKVCLNSEKFYKSIHIPNINPINTSWGALDVLVNFFVSIGNTIIPVLNILVRIVMYICGLVKSVADLFKDLAHLVA